MNAPASHGIDSADAMVVLRRKPVRLVAGKRLDRVVFGFDDEGRLVHGEPLDEDALRRLSKSNVAIKDQFLVMLASEVVALRAEVERLRSRL